MRNRSLARIAGALVAAAGTATALALPAGADTPEGPDATVASPEMLSAMQRDLGLTEQEALTRVAVEATAVETEEELRASLGSSFGGAHFDGDTNTLVVGVTTAEKADEVRAAGATPEVVAYSADSLDGVVSTLNETTEVPDGVTGWYVDTADNTVVVTTALGSGEAAADFVADSGVNADAVTVVESTEQPRTLYDIIGGDAYYFGGSRCSVGFSVSVGYVTAGHCGGVGTATQGYNRVSSGQVAGSVFPGSDMGYVRTNANWTPRPLVNRYSGNTTVTVSGSTEAAVGASICRSGSTTGWRCGTVQAKNQTVFYAQGAVSGLTRTNACAEGGDSGGSWLSGSQAQGVTSGGSGNCTWGGTTYFQPLNPILSRWGLSLTRG
ncbi:S1 family peptidase [Actinoalloteichus sp. AHMU CJ021]|uniref:Streptogrisin C n=2 Tax=Actinoalloteichus cyanogriseus TaxID=2893586 RepID=A0ABT1JJB9_ACTCY|nr:S1 family peptidase [Actinoalloteichus caeruleus]AUS78498.1 S1 family peptidase [Actinoalloteichus sp. AHMU CJ021]MCP2332601.1 streptogrisin C [Actinoalloteichus caeruleus DSM 43889]